MSDQSTQVDLVQQAVEYRIIDGFPAYRVGTDGSVWSRWRGGPGQLLGEWKILRPSRDREGYRRVDLRDGQGGCVTRKVCGLVATAFIGPRPQGMECRHLRGNDAGDGVDNLAWGTSLENHADKRRHGTIARGGRHGRVKLTDEQIAELLALKGTVIQRVAADRFGVSRGYVGQLWSGARARVPT